MQEDEFGGGRAQQAHVQFRLNGRIEAFETQCGFALMEGVVVGPAALFIVADEPELGLCVTVREIVDALVEDGVLGLATTRELDDMAGITFGCSRAAINATGSISPSGSLSTSAWPVGMNFGCQEILCLLFSTSFHFGLDVKYVYSRMWAMSSPVAPS